MGCIARPEVNNRTVETQSHCNIIQYLLYIHQNIPIRLLHHKEVQRIEHTITSLMF